MALDLATVAAPLLAAVGEAGFAAAVARRAGAAPAEVGRRIADVVSEAELALRLLAHPRFALRAGDRLLEIGAGTGLVATVLARAGVAVTAIEPLIAGFDLFAPIRAELEALAPDAAPLDRRAAVELSPAKDGRFDRIFSINVLEHCQPLGPSLDAMAAVLGPGGHMLHTCPNYRVPYEPHVHAPLVPMAPRLTARLAPSLARDPVWATLNFVTAGDLARFARRAGLELELVPGVLADAILRLATDPAFARRQGWAGRLAAAVGRTGLLARIPASWQTPMVAIFRRGRP